MLKNLSLSRYLYFDLTRGHTIYQPLKNTNDLLKFLHTLYEICWNFSKLKTNTLEKSVQE